LPADFVSENRKYWLKMPEISHFPAFYVVFLADWDDTPATAQRVEHIRQKGLHHEQERTHLGSC
jgi:hypothetical protein